MSMCRVFSCVVGRGCLLWPVRSLDKTLLAFALLHSVLQGQIRLLLQVFLDFLLLHSSPLWWKGHFFWGVLGLEGLVGLHRTIQLLLFQHYWSGHRLGLLWYWMVCLGKLPDGRDWLRGKLGLVLMGGAMLSKSLIQFSVDGWSGAPSLLFTWIQTLVEVMKIMATSFKRPQAHIVTLSAPNPAAGHHQPMLPPETSVHSWASLGQSLVG